MIFIKHLRYLCSIKYNSQKITNVKRLVPTKATKSKIDSELLPPRTKIDENTIALLERLSLVDCANKKGIETLEEAIRFADQIQQVNTEGVEPLITVLEDQPLVTRDDEVTEGNCKELILKNAALVDDDYFVAPPGNIPLESRKDLLFKEDDDKSDHLRIGPFGVLLREIVKTEWLNFHVTHKDVNIFLNEGGSFKDSFEFVKKLYNDQFPFGIAEMIPDKDEHLTKNSNGLKYDKDFSNRTLLRCTIFVVPSMSTQFFHQWQRQRRIWWRKFSANPDRYCFSDIENIGPNHQSVDILAKHPWGTDILEKITINTSLPAGLTEQHLQIKNGKKAVTVHHIVNEISLSALTFNTICDAYEEPKFMDKNRHVLHFHRKIAPYKLAFAITAREGSIVSELEDLALYLCKLLKNQNVTTLVLPNTHRIALGSLWTQFDEMGVPYTVHLKEETLKNGIFGLRSRDTTLEEQVHVTQFVDYIEKILRNF